MAQLISFAPTTFVQVNYKILDFRVPIGGSDDDTAVVPPDQSNHESTSGIFLV